MHLWRKVRRVWLSVSSRLKSHKSNTGGGGAIGGGLSKLEDDINMCGYKDVQVMWNLLNTSQIKQIGSVSVAVATPVSHSRKCSKQKPSNWLAFFWSNQTPNNNTSVSPSSSSSSSSSSNSSSSFCWVKSSKSLYN